MTTATGSPLSRIHRLPASVVNKIAAGEVIERPASVVKELLENAVDAQATRIEVTIEDGGLQLIRVADNGGGISGEDLPLAVAPHATSKINDADDLFRVTSLGFRGEALASIAEISQLCIRTQTRDSNTGHELLVHGGVAEPVVPCGCAIGTVVEVSDLFFNTPVRQKFLRTSQTEMGHVTEAFQRVALAHPNIQFVLRSQSRTLHDLPAHQSLADRIGQLLGDELRTALIPINGNDGPVELTGFVVDPTHSRSHNRLQYLFLNGRYIRERSLQHAIGEAYRGLLLTGRYPICFLHIRMPANIVDVNVHPAKQEVRFVDGGRIYSLVLGSIRNKFLATDLTARTHSTSPPLPESAGAHSALPPAATSAPYSQQAIPLSSSSAAFDWTAAPRAAMPDDPHGFPGAAASAPHAPFHPFPELPTSAPGTMRPPPPSLAPGRSAALQVHNRYLITESEEGMVVIDQHALHERIIYEQLREKVVQGKLETQKLLVPEPVDLSAQEYALVIDAREVLQQIGISVQPFGGTTVLIDAYPAMLANQDPGETLRSVIERLATPSTSVSRRDVLDELLHMISCKAAVKAGDRLTTAEIDALLEHRKLCQNSHHCPHGRPTALIFSREELDRRFKRT